MSYRHWGINEGKKLQNIFIYKFINKYILKYFLQGKKLAMSREILFLMLDNLDKCDRISFVKLDGGGVMLCPLICCTREN